MIRPAYIPPPWEAENQLEEQERRWVDYVRARYRSTRKHWNQLSEAKKIARLTAGRDAPKPHQTLPLRTT